MCWKKVEQICKGFEESEFISLSKPEERKFIIHVIAEEYPEISRVRIASTLDRSIKHLPNPINRGAFIRFMQTSL